MPGKQIREMREGRLIKPSDVERITRAIADAKGNPDFYVPHSTLADIEAGSIPSIHKLFSLAIALGVSLDEVLRPFGVDPEEVASYGVERRPEALRLTKGEGLEPGFRFQLNFDVNSNPQQTTLLRGQPQEMETLHPRLQARLDPRRYRYAMIGSKDDSMADLLPPLSLVEIDTTQATVQVGAWRTLRDRPIYLVWHTDGYACCWCQLDDRELTLLPHPLSLQPVRRFKMGRQATVIGRVINAWLPFGAGPLQPGA
jgi:transcriptional regulator with XRE-family HTH domain